MNSSHIDFQQANARIDISSVYVPLLRFNQVVNAYHWFPNKETETETEIEPETETETATFTLT